MANFVNQATLEYDVYSIRSNRTIGEYEEVVSANITTKSRVYYRPGAVIYSINLLNHSENEIPDITLVNTIRYHEGKSNDFADTVMPLDYVENSVKYYVNDTLGAVPTTLVKDELLTFSNITLPANSEGTIIFEMVTNKYTPFDVNDAIVNTVTISGTGFNPFKAMSIVHHDAYSDIRIFKSMNPTMVSKNDVLTYTIKIENHGSGALTAEENAIIKDLLFPPLQNLVVTYENSTWQKDTNYTYDETTGEFESEDNQIVLAPATSTRNDDTGIITITPSVKTLTISGNVL